jgi:thiamine biosynthesis lipoprotein
LVAVEAVAPDEVIAQQALSDAFEAIERVERLMHPTQSGSDLWALATCRAGARLRVHRWTWAVLRLSRRLQQESSGVFDPCPDHVRGSLTDLQFVAPGEIEARIPVQIDLGGIAKGFAVDQAIAALRRRRCSGGLVNAGGDLRVFGPHPRQIVCRSAERSIVVELREQALASSDSTCGQRPREHRGYYHGLDRHAPVSGSATVLAHRAVIADALTKCLLSGEASMHHRLLKKYGATRL